MSSDEPGDRGPRASEGITEGEAAASVEERSFAERSAEELAEQLAEERALDEFAQRTDWAAWSAAPVPSGFAQRVVARRELGAQREPRRPPGSGAGLPVRGWPVRVLPVKGVRGRAWLAALVAGALALVVGAWVVGPSLSGSLEWVESFLERGRGEGQLRAEVRTELSIGRRAVAVLEAGAEVSWQGERVEQRRGSVFYRVNPGAGFRVSSPDGSVEVLGTCFGVEVGERAARASATRVDVYEGRVRASAGAEGAELRAGESAQLSTDGVKVSVSEGGSPARAALHLGASPGDPAPPANVDPAGVESLRRQLGRVEEQKKALESQLRAAEAGLRRLRDAPPPRHPFDLTPADWKELAVQGTVKFRVPCSTPGWRVSAEALDTLGLAPDDAAPLEAAYARSRERLWEVLRPLCVAALGSEKVPELLGRTGCISGILAAARETDQAAAGEAMREVGEIRAGLRDAPERAIADNPALRALLALTAEPARFEAELSETFGPDEARELAYSDVLCRTELEFSGPGPRKATGNGNGDRKGPQDE
jgi:FecR-like protein